MKTASYRWHLLIGLIHLCFFAQSQTFVVSGITANSDQSAQVINGHAPPCLVNIPADACTFNALLGGYLGYDYGNTCFSRANIQDCQAPFADQVSTTCGSRAFVDGDGSAFLRIKWKNLVHNFVTADGHSNEGTASLNLNVTVNLNTLLPTPTTVYYRYSMVGGGSTEHENTPNPTEDSLFVANEASLNGNDFTQGDFSTTNISQFKNSGLQYGSFDVAPGGNFIFDVQSNIRAYLKEDPIPVNPPVDENDGVFIGFIEFSLSPLIIIEPSPENQSHLLFSTDIGSDSDWTDPNISGNEVFDPGDVYVRSLVPIIPSNGVWDDASLYGVDPQPAFPGDLPLYGGPLPYNINFMDLDGLDVTEFSLHSIMQADPDNTLNWPINSFISECVYPAEYLIISMDDDSSLGHIDVPGTPVVSKAPSGNTFGQTFNYDEVISLGMDPQFGGINYQWPLLNEGQVHASLLPNPIPLIEFEDDDVDALDFIPGIPGQNSPCNTYYFSVDHEATYFDQINGNQFNPGSIYEAVPGIGAVEVIHFTDLGLLPETDLDAFEFGFASDPSQDNYTPYFAILFSVDDDDALTPLDESAGLDPRKVYISFGTGTFHDFSHTPAPDDIDAITISPDPMDSQSMACNFTFYPDNDGDGFGDQDLTLAVNNCWAPSGYVNNSSDCDDNDDEVYPGAPGTGDGKDNNCDGVIDPSEAAPCLGDFNGDNVISIADLLILLADLGCQSNCTADLNNDGQVSIADLLILLTLLGNSCP